MIYPYRCSKCGKEFEVVKGHEHSGDPESCECGAYGVRIFTPPVISEKCKIGGFKEYFNHGLGVPISSPGEAEAIAKSRDLIEVGNEKPATIRKEVEKMKETKPEYDMAGAMQMAAAMPDFEP
ncbi:MAG TPA: hypothetical protein P5110_07650 [Candidatus Omnitrophota bacterium]|nr:hypothetical protein [Candidatus Omnitrophota bacterium]